MTGFTRISVAIGLAWMSTLARAEKGPVTLTVAATTDLFKAGGYNDGSNGAPPVSYTFPAHGGQALTFTSVKGTWTCTVESSPYFGPDGSCSKNGQIISNPIGPFSGYDLTDFDGALAGMFLEDTLPASAPPPLRFYDKDSSKGGIRANFQTLSPLIGQVFFIGDGLTGTGKGTTQVFRVPPTATHLFLGYVDDCNPPSTDHPGCYSDNAGQMTAKFHIAPFDWLEPAVTSAPAGRCCAGMAYDPTMRRTLLFGGFGNPAYYGDTWTWHHGVWQQLSPATSPSARTGPAMVWDRTALNIVMFGGTDSSGNDLNETWTWDGTNWTQQTPPVSPPPRRFDTTTGMAYDEATGNVVMFGGYYGDSSVLGDTWIWNGQSKTWTQQSPAATPSPRRTVLVYNPNNKTVVLFGGDDGAGTYYSDTWTWDGTTWTEQFPATIPAVRSMPAIAYDVSLGLVVMFSGNTAANDTWVWTGKNWKQLKPGHAPAARWSAATAFDRYSDGIVIFGGDGGNGTLADTWTFTPAR